MIDDVALIVQEVQDVILAHVMPVVDDGRTADVGAIGVDEHIGPLLKAELDPRIVIVIALEAGAHRGEGVDEGHLERLGEIGHHIDAIDLRGHHLVLEDVLEEDVLPGSLVILGGELSVWNALDRIGEHFAQDVLRAAFREILGSTAMERPLVDGLVLREQTVELMVVRALRHLRLGGVVACVHLGDLFGCKLRLIDVPALLLLNH